MYISEPEFLSVGVSKGSWEIAGLTKPRAGSLAPSPAIGQLSLDVSGFPSIPSSSSKCTQCDTVLSFASLIFDVAQILWGRLCVLVVVGFASSWTVHFLKKRLIMPRGQTSVL